jgi:hypothetical protein
MAKTEGRRSMVDAIELLKEDHKNVNHLFAELEKLKGARRQQTGARILEQLEVHTQIEEEIFYPAIRELPDEKAQEMVKEAYEEHRLAKDVIGELKGREPDEEMYDAQFKVLRENIEHHVEEEEENEMFPHIRPLMRDQLTVLGTRMQARKRELQKSPGSVTETLRGLMNRAYEAVAGSEGKPKRKAKRASAAETKAARRLTRARRSASAKRKTAKKSAGRVRAAAKAVARKRPSAKPKSSAAQPKRLRGRTRRAGRRVASRKR